MTINDANQAISGGNPAVKPERAWGLDGYFEWYLRPQGYLMAGVFYKNVKDVLYRQSRTFGSDALSSGGVDRSSYIFSGITNGYCLHLAVEARVAEPPGTPLRPEIEVEPLGVFVGNEFAAARQNDRVYKILR